jgi:hypothetical protein
MSERRIARRNRRMLMIGLLPVTAAALLFAVVAANPPARRSTTSTLSTIGRAAPWIALALAVFAVLVVVLPPQLVARRIRRLGELSPAEQVEAENDVRLALLQAIGSILLAGGFFFTWLQLNQGQKQFSSNLRQNGMQLSITRKGQLAERFSRAIEQLGSKEVDVRIGGIYALEGLIEDLDLPGDPALALEGEQERRTNRQAIVEILASYVRRHAPWDPAQARPSHRGDPATKDLTTRAADIQAAMSILGRRANSAGAPLVLAQTDLRGLRLTCATPGDPSCARLDEADFTGSNLDGADLFGASLPAVQFASARLEFARLANAQLGGANFHAADLADTNLNGADLHQAVLQGANLARAQLDQTDLDHASLQGAQLFGVDLTTARNLGTTGLRCAHADKGTKWPPGFDWRAAGVVLGPPSPTSAC